MADNKDKDKDKNYAGMYNFQGIMDSFYNYKPGGDDELGNSIKNTFAANMIQSAFDKDMAKEMGEFQNALGQSNMKAAADLELANNSAMMEQEFNFGMDSMEAQFGYQNEFANAQYDRDIGMIAATGQDARKNQDNLSFNNRQEAIVAGEQQRLSDTNRIETTGKEERDTIGKTAQEQRDTDTNRIETTGQEERDTIGKQASEQRETIKQQGTTQKDVDKSRIETTGKEERSTLGTKGIEERSTLETKGKEERSTIETTAKEGRTTMDFENRLQARTRADQSKYARQTARSF